MERKHRSLQGNPRYTDLYTRFDRIAVVSPRHGHFIIFGNSAPVDNPIDHPLVASARDDLKSWLAWMEVLSAYGHERRARKLVDALHTTLEGSYKRYLQLLWRLDRVERGLALDVDEPVDVGKLASDVDAAGLDHLIDPDTRFLRNATAHRHFRYVPAEIAVLLENHPRGGAPIERRTVPLDELLRRGEEILVAGTRFRAALFDVHMRRICIDRGALREMIAAVSAIGMKSADEITHQLGVSMRDALAISASNAPGRA
jgi:hypothetical protein